MGTPIDFVEQAEQEHFNRQPITQRMPEEPMLESHQVNRRENELMAQIGIVLEDYEVCFKPRYKKLVSGLRTRVTNAYLNMSDGYSRKQYIEALGVGRQLQQDMQGNGKQGFMATIQNVFSGKKK